MSSTIGGLRRDSPFKDLTIVCGSQTFEVHSFVICSQSKYLGGVCDELQKSGAPRRIVLSAEEGAILEEVISFCYDGEYTGSSEIWTDSRVLRHTQIFCKAKSYDMCKLQELAKKKLKIAIQNGWNEDNFEEAVREAYGTRDQELIPIFLRVIHTRCMELLGKSASTREGLLSIPNLARDLVTFAVDTLSRDENANVNSSQTKCTPPPVPGFENSTASTAHGRASAPSMTPASSHHKPRDVVTSIPNIHKIALEISTNKESVQRVRSETDRRSTSQQVLDLDKCTAEATAVEDVEEVLSDTDQMKYIARLLRKLSENEQKQIISTFKSNSVELISGRVKQQLRRKRDCACRSGSVSENGMLLAARLYLAIRCPDHKTLIMISRSTLDLDIPWQSLGDGVVNVYMKVLEILLESLERVNEQENELKKRKTATSDDKSPDTENSGTRKKRKIKQTSENCINPPVKKGGLATAPLTHVDYD